MTTTFATLGLSPDVVRALTAAGITDPFPIQALTIADGLAGRDVCGKAKTGSGKTLAFGLPMIERTEKAAPCRPRALVLVPTRELALQVSDALAPIAAARDRTVGVLYGGAAVERQISALQAGLDIAVATPGRLIDLLDRGALKLSDVDFVVIDEADRMADMGFLPQVEWVLRKLDHPAQTLLFSATLDGDVRYLIRHYLHDPVHHEVVSTQATVEEMEHRFLAVHQMDKVKVTAAIARGANRTLVFVRTKRGADRLVLQLRREGVQAHAIHGDLRQSLREKALKDFAAGTQQVLVATDVAARGIHVDAIDVVVHYDPPEDQKGYLHRSGRTARAGVAGVVATLVLWDQMLHVERLQKRLGVHQPIVEVFSNDTRLADLAAWDPSSVVEVA
ncbi:MAG: DEAD/DEAH box helicase [Actinobacteria bacterium]|nr:MAG: DEAD/DEAH box helicase [Actinomycetota bacterium]